jgi:hypothetical protein
MFNLRKKKLITLVFLSTIACDENGRNVQHAARDEILRKPFIWRNTLRKNRNNYNLPYLTPTRQNRTLNQI